MRGDILRFLTGSRVLNCDVFAHTAHGRLCPAMVVPSWSKLLSALRKGMHKRDLKEVHEYSRPERTGTCPHG